MEIDYSLSRLPKTYKEVFDVYDPGVVEMSAIVDSLKKMQHGISLQYIPQVVTGEDEELITHLSVMHDINALAPLKKEYPELYSEIKQKVTGSKKSKFYLLDSIKGTNDE